MYRESEQFFGALSNLARRGAGWLTTSGSPQRALALSVARRALNRGLPALGQWAGPQVASGLAGLLPQQEYEWESELEISPIRRIYPDAMLEHLGHAAAETHSEAEAESLAGAMVPLAARIIPRAAPVLMRATPGLVSGVAGVVRSLHRNPATRPLLRVVPTIVRGTASTIAQQASRGVAVTPQAAVRALARQTLRVLGSPQQSVQAFRRSRALDQALHRTAGGPVAESPGCLQQCDKTFNECLNPPWWQFWKTPDPNKCLAQRSACMRGCSPRPSGCGEGLCEGPNCYACCDFHCPNNKSECYRLCSPYR
jgi:hypothetical protein